MADRTGFRQPALYTAHDYLEVIDMTLPKLEARPPWIIRTYAGFGDAEQSNRLFRENLSRGQRGLSIAFDLPTQTGYDSDHEMAQGEVGGTGVAVCHLGDLDLLLTEIDTGVINTSMTINATAPWLFALYIALADKRGVARHLLRGTTQNDLLKEFVGRGTHVFAPGPSLRLASDLVAFSAIETPNWNPINCCGYHYMESGASPDQEVGFAIGNALMLLDALRGRLDEKAFENVVRRISFFVNSGIELVPEIAKIRAYAQLWPAVCEREYGIADVRFRAGCQVRSLTLTEQQPEVNIVRIAFQTLPVILSADARVRALQLPGFREASGLPDQSEQTLSLRTQQVLMYETGICDYDDIFEGSVVVERETAATVTKAEAIIRLLRHEGYESAIGILSQALTVGLVEKQGDLEAGDTVRVGVNAFLDPVNATRPTTFSADIGERAAGVARHLDRLAAWRADRDEKAVASARAHLLKVAGTDENILPVSIALAKAGGTTGEWTQTLESAFGGRFKAPLGAEVSVARAPYVPKAPRPIRILLAKGGLDGHVNAIKLLAFACRQAGMEVVYTGLQQTPDAIAQAAIQEGVDLVGVSVLSGSHMHIAEALISKLGSRDEAIPLVMGGIIPDGDAVRLKAIGVADVFTPKDGEIGVIVQRLIDLAN